jgi:hypothetical protein
MPLMETPMRLLLTLAFTACSASSATREPQPPQPPQPPQAPSVPVTAAIDVVDGAPARGARMVFRARLDRHGVWNAPISVEFVVPRGAVVVGGKTQALVANETDAPPTIELMLAEVPAEDLLLVARSQVEGAGFTAKVSYAFGRPTPPKTGPDKSGPSLTSPTGVDLGPSVQIKK